MVRVLATLLRPDTGRAWVGGYDVVRQPNEVRRLIGLTGQYAAVDEILSGRQNLELFGRLFHLGAREASRRADELLERFDLTEAAGRAVGRYSGGMRRRLDLAASLVLAPQVLFLDEPTAGLDPRSRNGVWEAVRGLAEAGRTVLLTTQHLEEADHLADHVSIIDGGRVVAQGTPNELKEQVGGDRVEVVVRAARDLDVAAGILRDVGAGPVDVDPQLRRLSVPVTTGVVALTAAVRALQDADVTVEDVGLRRPTLDVVFVHLTARPHGAREVTA